MQTIERLRRVIRIRWITACYDGDGGGHAVTAAIIVGVLPGETIGNAPKADLNIGPIVRSDGRDLAC